jgi:hypothetical protein
MGCGRLRHYKLLVKRARVLFLVDTDKQMAAVHRDGQVCYTIPDVAKLARKKGKKVYALTFEEFENRSLGIDVLFCVAVFDVIVRKTRRKIIAAIASKLGAEGHGVIVIPRNDSTITSRFSSANGYQDGHVFKHHGLETFFCNFERYESVIADCDKEGLSLVCDLSTYRQVCLIFSKHQPGG